jgi:hypothetical protein
MDRARLVAIAQRGCRSRSTPVRPIYKLLTSILADVLTNWTPITFTSSEQLISSSWYPKNASTNLSLDSTQQATDTYALGYVCSWNGTNWHCGCRDSACAQS